MEYQTEKQGDENLIAKANLKRAKKIAIVYGLLTSFCLIALVYGFVQHGIVEKQKTQIDSLKNELKKMPQQNAVNSDSLQFLIERYKQEAEKQREIALTSTKEALEQKKLAEESEKRAHYLKMQAEIAVVQASQAQKLAAEAARRSQQALEEAMKKKNE